MYFPWQTARLHVLPPCRPDRYKVGFQWGLVCICFLMGEAEHLFRCWRVLCVLFIYRLIAFAHISVGCWFFLFYTPFLYWRVGLCDMSCKYFFFPSGWHLSSAFASAGFVLREVFYTFVVTFINLFIYGYWTLIHRKNFYPSMVLTFFPDAA